MDFMCSSNIVLIPVEQITPNIRQPRKQFDYKELESLTQSIKENGIIHPITVRPRKSNTFEIVTGERRFRASIMAGLSTIPCIIIESSDERTAILSLTENIQKKSLTFFEEAQAISNLIIKFNYTVEDIANIFGKSPSYILNKINLLSLPGEFHYKIIEEKLDEQYASLLTRLKNKKDIGNVLNAVIKHKLNISQTDELITRLIKSKSENDHPKRIMIFKDIKIFVNTINKAIDTMKKSGIEAKAEQTETDSYIKYTITIPKQPDSVIRSRK